MRKKLAKVHWWLWPGLILITPILLVVLLVWSPFYYIHKVCVAIDDLLSDDFAERD